MLVCLCFGGCGAGARAGPRAQLRLAVGEEALVAEGARAVPLVEGAHARLPQEGGLEAVALRQSALAQLRLQAACDFVTLCLCSF